MHCRAIRKFHAFCPKNVLSVKSMMECVGSANQTDQFAPKCKYTVPDAPKVTSCKSEKFYYIVYRTD